VLRSVYRMYGGSFMVYSVVGVYAAMSLAQMHQLWVPSLCTPSSPDVCVRSRAPPGTTLDLRVYVDASERRWPTDAPLAYHNPAYLPSEHLQVRLLSTPHVPAGPRNCGCDRCNPSERERLSWAR
jgi:hypothetical protein